MQCCLVHSDLYRRDSTKSNQIMVVIMYQKVGKPEGDSAEPRQKQTAAGSKA